MHRDIGMFVHGSSMHSFKWWAEEGGRKPSANQSQHLLFLELLAIPRQAPNRDAREMPPLHALAHGLCEGQVLWW